MADERPNILFIMTDQQRGDCLGLDGHPVLNTPNLDYLAHSGTLFRHGYSETPSCIPARRTVMSGQAPATHGMVGMTGGVDWQPDATLAGELSAAGYQCEMIGKLHLWPHRKRFGFHHMLVADSTRGKDNDYLDWLGGAVPIERWAMAHGISPNGWQARPNHVPEEQTHTFWCISQAIEFLSKRDPTVPFFLNVSFIDPHPPFTPPQFYYDRYAGRDLGQPAVGDWAPQFPEPQKGFDPEGRMPRRQQLRLDDDTMHYCRAGYFGLINHVDTQIGRLLMYLRDERLLEESFILFTSDHGEMLGDQNMFAKTRPFESSARVPFLARAPMTMSYPRGIVTDRPGRLAGRDADPPRRSRPAHPGVGHRAQRPAADARRGRGVARGAARRARRPVRSRRRQSLSGGRPHQIRVARPDRRGATVRSGPTTRWSSTTC